MAQVQFNFQVYSETDKRTGALLAVYFQIRHGKAAEVREIADGAAFANFDRKGRLLGVELLGPCEVTLIAKLSQKDPDVKHRNRIKRFLHDHMPKKMAISG